MKIKSERFFIGKRSPQIIVPDKDRIILGRYVHKLCAGSLLTRVGGMSKKSKFFCFTGLLLNHLSG